MRAYKILGFNADVCECDVCGKSELKGTYAIEDLETGEIFRAGSTCGAKMAGWTTKVFTKKVKEVELAQKEAKEIALRSSVEYFEYQKAIDFLNKESEEFNIKMSKANEAERYELAKTERTYESRIEILKPLKEALRKREIILHNER